MKLIISPVCFQVQVEVLDINDHSPSFVGSKTYSIVLSQNVAAKTIIYTFETTDLDVQMNAEVAYSSVTPLPGKMINISVAAEAQ